MRNNKCHNAHLSTPWTESGLRVTGGGSDTLKWFELNWNDRHNSNLTIHANRDHFHKIRLDDLVPSWPYLCWPLSWGRCKEQQKDLLYWSNPVEVPRNAKLTVSHIRIMSEQSQHPAASSSLYLKWFILVNIGMEIGWRLYQPGEAVIRKGTEWSIFSSKSQKFNFSNRVPNLGWVGGWLYKKKL